MKKISPLSPIKQLISIYIFIASVIILGISIGISQFRSKQAEIFYQANQGLGLGQCHGTYGSFNTNSGIRWGYSSSTYFDFSNGAGDSWAAIEPQEGTYNFSQKRSEVDKARSLGKKVMLQIQVGDKSNKEHNVPKWAINKGIETYISAGCGDLNVYRNKSRYVWYDPNNLKNSVKPVWPNSQFVDVSEAKYLKETSPGSNSFTELTLPASGSTTPPEGTTHIQFPTKIAAVWDPLFQDYYANALRAMKQEFQQDIDDGVVEAIQMMSGGESGECVLSSKCPAYCDPSRKNPSCSCLPDVLNPDCPAVLSLAKYVQKQHYPTLSVQQVASDIVAKRSTCNPSNLVPGNKVEVCTESDQLKCPLDSVNNSECFVFDDYFIQAMKQIITSYVEIFAPTPVVWQRGNGLSATGRVGKILEIWMDSTYQSNIWLKFNGWGPRDSKMQNGNFSRYQNVGAHGYEPDHPNNFSKLIYWKGKEEDGKQAIINAIKGGIVSDKSSYLCLQSSFFTDPPVSVGNGLSSNQYYFNPTDQDPNCSSSEINVAQYGVGFCPGFLNKAMLTNVPIYSGNTPYPTPTLTPTSNPTPFVCTTNATRCQGSIVQTCTNNQWVTRTDCTQSDTYCLSGSCHSYACSSGAKRCSNGNIETCSSDRKGWVVSSTCTSGSVCSTTTFTCQAIPNYCASGSAPRCTGNTPQTCTNNQWTNQNSCTSSQVCENGACVPVSGSVCTPQQKRCASQSSYQVCNTQGTAWESAVACSQGEECTGNGICMTIENYCPSNGSMRCSTTGIPQLCTSNRWVNQAPCATGTSCSSGTCIPSSGGIDFTCTGQTPTYAQLCSGDSQGLTANLPKTLVPACTANRKCEYTCNSGYQLISGSCQLPSQSYTCIGSVPAHSQPCSNYLAGLTANTAVRLADACTGDVRCTYICTQGYYRQGVSCVVSNAPVQTPTITPTPTPNPSPVPQATPPYSCYHSCSVNAQCQSPLVCRSVEGESKCVNVECPKENDCSCSPTVPKAPELPKSGFVPVYVQLIGILLAIAAIGAMAVLGKRKR